MVTQASASEMGVTSLCLEPGRRAQSCLCRCLQALLNPGILMEVHYFTSVCLCVLSRREALLDSCVLLA